MNIGIFTNAYKPIISGVVNSISLFKEGLTRLGHNVYVFAPGFPDYKDIESHVYRFRSISITQKVKYPLAIPISNRIAKIIPGLKLDVIHTQHPYILGEVGANYARKFKIPLVYTFHTQFEQYSHYIPFNQDIVKMLARLSVISYTKKCDCIITPAPSIMELLKSYGIKQRVEILPNAIDLSSFENSDRKKIRAKYSIGHNEKVLINIGRLGLEKNLAFMLHAFKIISHKVHNAKLMIVGEGPEEKALKDLAQELGLGKKVIFTGRIDYSEIPYYYGAADIFIMTSVTEVKPLAILEAMASGLPMVAVAASGSSDTITSGLDGILTELNIEDFASETLKLLENHDLIKKMGSHAKHTAARYSIISTSQKLAQVYEDLMREKHRRLKN